MRTPEEIRGAAEYALKQVMRSIENEDREIQVIPRSERIQSKRYFEGQADAFARLINFIDEMTDSI